ncbi:MAG: hypothetical protein H0V89_03960 [Deltaproteobacteria bacterium]|nr:hypothetical protein [Deltaproteobacteria bacterium]
MTRFAWLLGVMGLVACGDKDDTGEGSAVEDDGPAAEECLNLVSETFPATGTADAFYMTSVEFTLQTVEADATVTVTGPSGEVSGSSVVDGNRVLWTADAPLEASTAYEANLNWSCEATTIAFTTSDVGSEVPATDLTGNVYSLPLTEGRFVEPEGLGEIIGGLLDVSVLIEVTSATETDLEMMGALASETDPNAQDLCTETIDFPAVADFSANPFFSVGPADTLISVAGIDIAVDDLAISGAFSPDGDRIAGAAFSGSIDTRPLVELVGTGTEEDSVCALVLGFGIECIACSDGSGNFCLALAVEDMTAEIVAGTDLVPVGPDDVESNPDCATTTP